MTSETKKRLGQRGNSFASCLLSVVVVFGGLGFYYFNYFQWRHLENPTDDITYVKQNSPSVLNDFRRKTVKDISDAALQTVKRLKQIRKDTKKGTEEYPEFEQECIEVRNKLKDIMNEARLRRIPKQYKRQYEHLLKGLGYGYQSVNKLQASFEQETADQQQKYYKDSIILYKKSMKESKIARDYFHSGFKGE